MMASNSVSSVYIHVIDDVISKVREEFVNTGAGEGVLSELQALWEMKMLQCGAITGAIERSALPKPAGTITPVHDLNVPYEGPMEEYETPTAEMLFPPTPGQTPLPGMAQTPLPGTAQTPLPGMVQTPLPGTVDQSMYNNIPNGPPDFAPVNGAEFKAGRPNPYMQPPSPWMTQRPLGVDVNVAYVENHEEVDRGAPHQPMTQDFFMMSSGKRKRDDYASQLASGSYIPQQDGNGDFTIEFFLPEANENKNSSTSCSRGSGTSSNQVLPQQDGVHDEFDDLFHFQGVATEDYNSNTPGDHVELRAGTPAVGTPAVGTPVVGTPKPTKSEAVDDDEPPLNEDDDDDDDLDDFEQGEEEPNTQHLVLAQFDKVTRTKSRWKCTLKDGIMHINNRDILFNKANGEFDF